MSTRQRLLEQLHKLRSTKTVIVCIGNTLKGDDGAGPAVYHQLRHAGICAELIDAGTVPENYIQRIIKKNPKNLLVIDAIDFAAAAGAIEIFDSQQLSSLVISTHTLSPRLFVDLIRQDIEVDVYFIGIEPAQTQLGQPLSAKVTQAVEQLSNILIKIFPPAPPTP